MSTDKYQKSFQNRHIQEYDYIKPMVALGISETPHQGQNDESPERSIQFLRWDHLSIRIHVNDTILIFQVKFIAAYSSIQILKAIFSQQSVMCFQKIMIDIQILLVQTSMHNLFFQRHQSCFILYMAMYNAEALDFNFKGLFGSLPPQITCLGQTPIPDIYF